MGPVQYFVIEFPGNKFNGKIVPALQDLIANGLIQIVDIVFVTKDENGAIGEFELSEVSDEEAKTFSSVVSTISGILHEEDIQTLTSDLPNNSSAALLVFEHVWAIGLADAIRDSQGQVVAQGFVPREVVEQVMSSRQEA